MSKKLQDTMYYIQNGYVGNAILWWGIDGRGYTTDFKQAGKYTKEETEKIIQRPQDIAWPCDYVDNKIEAQRLIIDSQYLEYSYRVVGNKK